MASQTEAVQEQLRQITGTAGMYNEDWHAYLTSQGIPQGQLNERMLALATQYNPTIQTASAAHNYFLQNGVFSPISLFAGGEQGGWYDWWDKSVLFQDSAATTPVTAAGQPIGFVLDRSGRGNHLIQPTPANRPVYDVDANGKFHASFNGTNQWMQSVGNVDLSATDKLTAWAGVRKVSDAGGAILCELTTGTANNGMFYISAPDIAAPLYGFATRGTVAYVNRSPAGFPAPLTSVLSCALDNAGSGAAELAQVRPRVNGLPLTGKSGTSPGNYSSAILYIGCRAGTTAFFNGNQYATIIRGAASTGAQIIAAENYVNAYTGGY